MPATDYTERQVYRLREDFLRLTDMMEELVSWQDSLDEADTLARECLAREVEAEFDRLTSDLALRGPDLWAWLRDLQDRVSSAEAELARLKRVLVVREQAHLRAKMLTTQIVEQLPGKKLEGGTWKLQVYRNGGQEPLVWDEQTPFPVQLARKVEVDPVELVNRVRELTALGCPVDDRALLAKLGILHLEPQASKVREAFEEQGELPRGFEFKPRGQHLRVT